MRFSKNKFGWKSPFFYSQLNYLITSRSPVKSVIVETISQILVETCDT